MPNEIESRIVHRCPSLRPAGSGTSLAGSPWPALPGPGPSRPWVTSGQRDPAAAEDLAQPQHDRGLAEQVRVPAPGGNSTSAASALSSAGFPAWPPSRCSQVSRDLAGAISSCSSSGSGISMTSVASASPGSDSVIARIAGIADSSPMNRCQSAPTVTVETFPRGPIPSIVSPGRADRSQRSPGPSPCSTTLSVSRRARRVERPDGVAAPDRLAAFGGDQQHHVLARQVAESGQFRCGQRDPLHAHRHSLVADDFETQPAGSGERLGERILKLLAYLWGQGVSHARRPLFVPARTAAARLGFDAARDWLAAAGLGITLRQADRGPLPGVQVSNCL